MILPSTTTFKPQGYEQLPLQIHSPQMNPVHQVSLDKETPFNGFNPQNGAAFSLSSGDTFSPAQTPIVPNNSIVKANTLQPFNRFQTQPPAVATQPTINNEPIDLPVRGQQTIGEVVQQARPINNTDTTHALNPPRQNQELIGQSLLRTGKVMPSQLNQALSLQSDQRIIQQALTLLGEIQFSPADLQYMHHLGIQPPFQNGAEALQQIRSNGVRVEFGDMGDSPAHAQWVQEQNLIMINQKYRGDASPATLYAISEAICHEAGHASGNGDGQSSIQEELNCLALNALAHRYHKTIDPTYAQTTSTSPLIANGVALYDRLFFDPDPNKQALIKRVIQKYGDLPMWSPGHKVPEPLPLAYRIAAQIDANNTASGKIAPSATLQQSPGLSVPIPPPEAVAPQLNRAA